MNRYEIVMRQNVAKNLKLFIKDGLPPDISLNDQTPNEKRLRHSRSLPAFAKVFNDFIATALAYPDRGDLSIEAQAIKRGSDNLYLAGNAVGKVRNWDEQFPTKNRIGLEKVAAIRDYLMSRGLFRKYHAVALNADERFHSVVDFVSTAEGPTLDLQDRMRKVRPPEDDRYLHGAYWVFRRSMTDPTKYVKLDLEFEFTPVRSCLYRTKGTVRRGSSAFTVQAEGFYLYLNQCFVLTGRYDFITPGGAVHSQIDHMILYDDKDDSVLNGLWTVAHTRKREPRCMGVALLSATDFDQHRGISDYGDFEKLPHEIKSLIIEAEAYRVDNT